MGRLGVWPGGSVPPDQPPPPPSVDKHIPQPVLWALAVGQGSPTLRPRGDYGSGSPRALATEWASCYLPYCAQGQAGNRLKGGGGLPPPPVHRLYPKGIPIPQHQPQPHFQPPEIAPPPNRFHIPRDRSATALGLPRWPPPLPFKQSLGKGVQGAARRWCRGSSQWTGPRLVGPGQGRPSRRSWGRNHLSPRVSRRRFAGPMPPGGA